MEQMDVLELVFQSLNKNDRVPRFGSNLDHGEKILRIAFVDTHETFTLVAVKEVN
jgi:hypothetical protein